MFDLIRFRLLLKKYKTIFEDIIGNMKLESFENNRIILSDRYDTKIIATMTDDSINFTSENDDIEKYITFKIPDSKVSNIEVIETIKEKRPKAYIIEKLEKVYGFTKFSNGERYLIDLNSKRYVMNYDNFLFKSLDDNYLEQKCIMKTLFESHMKTANKVRWYTDFPYSTKTILNNQDISKIYDIVEGKDKISIIYDLYNGIINKRNENDILAIHLGLLNKEALGYKQQIGITEQEDSICGQFNNNPYKQDTKFINHLIQDRIGYNYPFDCDDLSSLINAITYDGFEQLDMNEQQIDKYKM